MRVAGPESAIQKDRKTTVNLHRLTRPPRKAVTLSPLSLTVPTRHVQFRLGPPVDRHLRTVDVALRRDGGR